MRENFVKKNKNKTKKQKDRKSVIILPFSFDQVSIRSLRTDGGITRVLISSLTRSMARTMYLTFEIVETSDCDDILII